MGYVASGGFECEYATCRPNQNRCEQAIKSRVGADIEYKLTWLNQLLELQALAELVTSEPAAVSVRSSDPTFSAKSSLENGHRHVRRNQLQRHAYRLTEKCSIRDS